MKSNEKIFLKKKDDNKKHGKFLNNKIKEGNENVKFAINYLKQKIKENNKYQNYFNKSKYKKIKRIRRK